MELKDKWVKALLRETRESHLELGLSMHHDALECRLASNGKQYAMINAIQKGFVVEKDDHLVWTLESDTLLAYFLGRLFCGDHPYYSTRKRESIWQHGSYDFPNSLAKALFNKTTLIKLRRQRKNCKVPKDFELVDVLFNR